MSIAALLRTMVSLFAAIAVGFAGAKLGFLDGSFNRQLTKLVIYLVHPLMVLASVLNKEHLLSNGQVLELIGIAVVCYGVMIPLSLLAVRLLRIPPADRGTCRFMLIFANVGFMGYPVVQALFGPDSSFYVTIYVLIFQLVVYTYGVHLLSDGTRPFRLQWRYFARPMVIAALAALVIYLLDLRMPETVANVASYIGNLSTPLSMIVIGCSLASIPMKQVFANPRIYGLAAWKLILFPLLAFAVAKPFISNPLLLGIITVTSAMPAATNATMLSVEYGGNQELASSGVFVSTILSMVTIPAIMWLLFR